MKSKLEGKNNVFGRIAHMLLTLCKSFWSATVQTAWGIATFFILAAVTSYYKSDTTLITGLFHIINVLMQNWQLVFCILFIFEVITNFNELDKARGLK